MESLGIELISEDEGMIVGKMPIDARTIQPMGILHGGATAALAETLGSYGSKVIAEKSDCFSVGVELHIHHLKSVATGFVVGTARLLKEGKTLHLWNIDITDTDGNMVATARLSVMMRPNRK